jgi:hypothetical protein
MELEIPPQDKLYYLYVTGPSKDAKKLMQLTQEFLIN